MIHESELNVNLKLKGAIRRKFRRQYLFAEALGVTDPYVSQVINGKPMSAENKERWAALLGVRVVDVFPGEEVLDGRPV